MIINRIKDGFKKFGVFLQNNLLVIQLYMKVLILEIIQMLFIYYARNHNP